MANPNPNQSTQFKAGNTVAYDAHRWKQAVNKAVSKPSGRSKLTMLEVVADKLVDLAASGDIAAIKEIGNRLDGMAHQSISVDQQGNDRSITVQLSFIKPPVQVAHEQPLAVTHTPATIEHDDALPVTPQADE